MTDVTVVAIIRQGVTTVLMVAGPMLGVGMIVGLLVSIFQATTQIQEQTLTFIPKLLAVFFYLGPFRPLMLRVLVDFTTELFPTLVKQVDGEEVIDLSNLVGDTNIPIYAGVLPNLGLNQRAAFQSRNLPPMVRVSIALFYPLFLSFRPTLGRPPNPFRGFRFLSASGVCAWFINRVYRLPDLCRVAAGGTLMDRPMGFTMVNVLDPYTGGQMPVVGQLYYIIALWLFILVKGDHTLIRVLSQSYQLIPVGEKFSLPKGCPISYRLFPPFLAGCPNCGADLWRTVPDRCRAGVLAKLVPQINVFFIGFPIKTFLGMTLLILSLPVLVRWLAGYFSANGRVWTELLRFLNTIR